MLSTIDTIYLAAAAAVAIVSYANLRGLAWLLALVAGYFVSGFYWRTGAPNGELVAGLCDAAVCGAIFVLGRYRWELWLWLLSQFSLLVNILYLVSNLSGARAIDHEVYSIALETLNALAFLLIGGVSAFQKTGMTDGIAFRPWVSILGFARPAYGSLAARSRSKE